MRKQAPSTGTAAAQRFATIHLPFLAQNAPVTYSCTPE